jgi:hypothetical protein
LLDSAQNLMPQREKLSLPDSVFHFHYESSADKADGVRAQG